jgi:acyl carrier protein
LQLQGRPPAGSAFEVEEGKMMPKSLKVVIAEVLEIDAAELQEASGVNETENWDSLHQFLIIAAVEQTFAVKLPFDVVEHAANIAEIRAALGSLGVSVGD